MTFVMSDIHGEYQKYLKMLEKINFQDNNNDTLYILGDTIDRGPQSAELLIDVFSRKNVIPLMGNHELMAIPMLEILLSDISEKEFQNRISYTAIYGLLNWKMNGGNSTCNSFSKINSTERLRLLSELKKLPLFKTLEVNGNRFVLVHSGINNFEESKPLESYTAEDFVFARPDFNKRYYSDSKTYVVFGHTPTNTVIGEPRIFKGSGNICIDCGATFENGKLGCLALETMEEFYV